MSQDKGVLSFVLTPGFRCGLTDFEGWRMSRALVRGRGSFTFSLGICDTVMCVCVCVHVRVHVRMHAYAQACKHVHMHVCVWCVCINVYDSLLHLKTTHLVIL